MSECKTCGVALSRRNSSGLCRKHFSAVSAANPETRRNQIEGIRRKHALDPEFKDRLRQRARALGTDKRYTEARSAAFRKGEYWKLGTASQTPETRAKAGRAISNTLLAWCPPALRQDYRDLINKHRFKASEARAMIEDQHEMDMARWRRSVGIELPVVPEVTFEAPDDLPPLQVALNLAAAHFRVTVEEILSKSREHKFVKPRYAITLAMHRVGFSYPVIARALNKGDHTSAMNWRERGAERVKTDRRFARTVDELVACWPVLEVAA